jgi:hypothetical protein
MSINLINIQTGSTTPSHTGMPISGCTLGMTVPVTESAPTYVVRDRVAADALVKGAFPGPSAWRPPIC